MVVVRGHALNDLAEGERESERREVLLCMVPCFVATHLQSMLDTRLPAAGKRASYECGKGCREALAVFLVVVYVCGGVRARAGRLRWLACAPGTASRAVDRP